MNENYLSKGIIEENSAGIGEISDEMVTERAKEIGFNEMVTQIRQIIRH